MSTDLYTHIYLLQAGRVLLAKGAQPPVEGLWVPPGGNVLPGESPYEAALRQVTAQTGLSVSGLRLRALVSLVADESADTSLQILYAGNDFSGELQPAAGQGQLQWQHLHRVFSLPMPAAHHRWLSEVLNLNLPLYQARYVLDKAQQIVEVVEQPGETER